MRQRHYSLSYVMSRLRLFFRPERAPLDPIPLQVGVKSPLTSILTISCCAWWTMHVPLVPESEWRQQLLAQQMISHSSKALVATMMRQTLGLCSHHTTCIDSRYGAYYWPTWGINNRCYAYLETTRYIFIQLFNMLHYHYYGRTPNIKCMYWLV